MTPSLEETIYVDFITSSPTTGAAVDADSTPTAEVFEDSTDTAILSPTVVKRTSKTGNYRVPLACTAANGFEAGKSYNVVASATVGAVAAKAIVQTFQVRTRDTDDLPVTGAAMTLTAAYDAAKTAAAPGAAMTLTSGERTTLAGAIWNTLTSALTTVGSIGKLLVDNIDAKISSITGGGGGGATVAAIWGELVPGSYAAGTAGNILGNRLDVAVSTRSTYSGADTAGTTTLLSRVPTTVSSQASNDAIKAQTDQLSFTGGKVNANAATAIVAGDIDAIAQAILKKDWTLVSGEAAYSVLNALRMLRNSWATPSGVLTVRKEDGTTVAWTRTLSTDPTAVPITGAT